MIASAEKVAVECTDINIDVAKALTTTAAASGPVEAVSDCANNVNDEDVAGAPDAHIPLGGDVMKGEDQELGRPEN